MAVIIDELFDGRIFWWDGDNRIGPILFGVDGEAFGCFDVLRLNAYYDGWLQAFVGLQNCFHSGKPFLVTKSEVLTGELRPDDALDAALIKEANFRSQGLHINFIGCGEWSMGDWENAFDCAKSFCETSDGAGTSKGQKMAAIHTCHTTILTSPHAACPMEET